MKVRFFDPGKGYKAHQKEYDAAIKRVLKAGQLILQEDGELFEKNLAEYVGTQYALALNSGTDALYLALRAIGIGPGDEVLVPSHTFVATPQVVAQLRAKPVLYENDEFDIKTTTKAVMVAHIAGEFQTNMQTLSKVLMGFNVPIIEDAAQAIGAEQNGKKAGSIGVAGCFSFYPAKILGSFGDAGGLVTNDKYIYEEVRELRNHYKKDYSKWGINSRLDNIQAAILNVKLKYLPEILKRRKEVAHKYLKNLKGVGLPNTVEGRVWQDFIIKSDNRERLYQLLKENGVETMRNDCPFPIQKLPASLEYESKTLRIPCNENLTDTEVDYVIEKTNEYADVR